MWSLWQAWKDEALRRIHAEREQARLIGILNNVEGPWETMH